MVGVTGNLFGKRGDDTFTVERSGRVFRQYGKPLAGSGHVGNFALDLSAAPYVLYQKARPWSGTDGSPWINVAAMPALPAPENAALRWYSEARLPNTLGAVGDYGLYTGFEATLLLWGPKTAYGWPENGDGGVLAQAQITSETPRGLLADGPALTVDTTSLITSSVSTTAGNVATTVVTTVTNQQTPFVLRGLLSEIASALGIDTTSIRQHGLQTFGRTFTGTLA